MTFPVIRTYFSFCKNILNLSLAIGILSEVIHRWLVLHGQICQQLKLNTFHQNILWTIYENKNPVIYIFYSEMGTYKGILPDVLGTYKNKKGRVCRI